MTTVAILAALTFSPAPWQVAVSGDSVLVVNPDGEFMVTRLSEARKAPVPFKAVESPDRLGLVAPIRAEQFAAFTNEAQPKFRFVFSDGGVGETVNPPADFEPKRLVGFQDGRVYAAGTQGGKPASHFFKDTTWTDLAGRGALDRGVDTGRVNVQFNVSKEDFAAGRGFAVTVTDQSELELYVGNDRMARAFILLPNLTPKGARPEVGLVRSSSLNSVAMVWRMEDPAAPLKLVLYGVRATVTGWADLDPKIVQATTPVGAVKDRVAVANIREAVVLAEDGTLHYLSLRPQAEFTRMAPLGSPTEGAKTGG